MFWFADRLIFESLAHHLIAQELCNILQSIFFESPIFWRGQDEIHRLRLYVKILFRRYGYNISAENLRIWVKKKKTSSLLVKWHEALMALLLNVNIRTLRRTLPTSNTLYEFLRGCPPGKGSSVPGPALSRRPHFFSWKQPAPGIGEK